VSQVVLKQTFRKSKRTSILATASKIIVQMNAKIGKVLWEIITAHPFWKDKDIMYGAFSINRSAKGYTLAFVGTTNKSLTKIFSDVRTSLMNK